MAGTEIKDRWLQYAWEVLRCPPRHVMRCEELGASRPGPGEADGNELRWPGYIGRNFGPEPRVLCVSIAHADPRELQHGQDPRILEVNRRLVATARKWLEGGRLAESDSAYLERTRREYEKAWDLWRVLAKFRRLVEDHLGLDRTQVAFGNLAKCRVAGSMERQRLARYCQRWMPASRLVEATAASMVLVSVIQAGTAGSIVGSWDTAEFHPRVFAFHGRRGTDSDGRRMEQWTQELRF
jgi:hypothetical protein